MTGFPEDSSADPAVQQPFICSGLLENHVCFLLKHLSHLPPAPTVIPHTSAGVRVRKDVHDAPPQPVL